MTTPESQDEVVNTADIAEKAEIAIHYLRVISSALIYAQIQARPFHKWLVKNKVIVPDVTDSDVEEDILAARAFCDTMSETMHRHLTLPTGQDHPGQYL